MQDETRPASRSAEVGEPGGTREKILEVSEALFSRRGFAGVGMREVADEVGLSKSTLFHHFDSKAQLYGNVMMRVLERIHSHVQIPLNSGDDPAEKLEAWLNALIDALADHSTSARLLLRGLFEEEAFPDPDGEESREVERALEGLIEPFHRLLRAGIERGVFRPVSVADATQTLIGATVYHFASGEFGESVIGGPIFSAEAVERRKREVAAFVRHGLAAPAANPRDRGERRGQDSG